MRDARDLPSALDHLAAIAARLRRGRALICLDYDGTLTAIVPRPEDAHLSLAMRQTVRALARRATVAVISGRDLDDVRGRVALPDLIYAGSHGFDIAGPGLAAGDPGGGARFLPLLDAVEADLGRGLVMVAGAQVERKRFSVAVHYRRADPADHGRIAEVVAGIAARHAGLRRGEGKMVWELLPDVDWHKGRAVRWLLDALGGHDLAPLYLGDDTTDEDAFAAIADRGVTILVRGDEPRATAAGLALDGVDQVQRFLAALTPLVR